MKVDSEESNSECDLNAFTLIVLDRIQKFSDRIVDEMQRFVLDVLGSHKVLLLLTSHIHPDGEADRKVEH